MIKLRYFLFEYVYFPGFQGVCLLFVYGWLKNREIFSICKLIVIIL